MISLFSTFSSPNILSILAAITLAFCVSCGAATGNVKSTQELSPQEKDMLKGLLHEALERTFSDYQLGKIYQEATVHRHPRNLKKELTPPIEGLAVVLGMFSPRYKEDDIRERIKKHLTSLRVGPKEGEIEISVSDYVVEFLPFGMMGGQMQVTIIPLSIETRKTK